METELRWYAGKASRVETGTRVPVPAEIDRLAELYRLGKRESPARVADFGQTYITLARLLAVVKSGRLDR